MARPARRPHPRPQADGLGGGGGRALDGERRPAPTEGPAPSLLERALGHARRFPRWARIQLIELVEAHPYAAVLAVYGFFRAMGVTVRTGRQGLMYSFGRATKTLEPGFHLMIPFLQVARVVPSRSRTLDLEDQQVATFDGLVYRVHATLVWRIVDVRKALVEVDDLLSGMRNALATSVWEVLERSERDTVRGSEALDAQLDERMQARLEPWGVVVERAGFQSIAPTGPTLALLQLRQRTGERERLARALASGVLAGRPLAASVAVGLLGTPRFPVRRQRRAAWNTAQSRRRRMLRLQARRLLAATRKA